LAGGIADNSVEFLDDESNPENRSAEKQLSAWRKTRLLEKKGMQHESALSLVVVCAYACVTPAVPNNIILFRSEMGKERGEDGKNVKVFRVRREWTEISWPLS
jgi:hypothetical protein